MNESATNDRADELREKMEAARTSGDPGFASMWSTDLGDSLAIRGDREGAECAYRQAVAFARETGVEQRWMMFFAFRSLINFLSPSAEAVALGAEAVDSLTSADAIDTEVYAADAAADWATAALKFAEIQPETTDAALSTAQQAIAMLGRLYFDQQMETLRAQVAATLRTVGRPSEAGQWAQASQ